MIIRNIVNFDNAVVKALFGSGLSIVCGTVSTGAGIAAPVVFAVCDYASGMYVDKVVAMYEKGSLNLKANILLSLDLQKPKLFCICDPDCRF